jgi:hypothetical protein
MPALSDMESCLSLSARWQERYVDSHFTEKWKSERLNNIPTITEEVPMIYPRSLSPEFDMSSTSQFCRELLPSILSCAESDSTLEN